MSFVRWHGRQARLRSEGRYRAHRRAEAPASGTFARDRACLGRTRSAVLHHYDRQAWPQRTDETPMTRHDRNLFIAGACGAVVGLMVAASYAAVPFYNWFCRTTGFAGTTQVVTTAPARELDRKIT